MSIIPIEWKLYATYLKSSNKDWKHIDKYKNKKKIIIAMAVDYANLGDVAINCVQYDFLKENFPDYEIINFPISKTFTYMKSLKSIVNKEDIITLIGGGNMGDLYWDMELCRQFIIKNFPCNKIVSFPQTFSCENNKKLEKCIKSYSKHKDLTFVFREKFSYDFCKDKFSNKVLLTPDIVLLLDYKNENLNREGISFVLREDKETFLSKIERENILNKLKENYKVNIFDTHIKMCRISFEKGKSLLFELLDKIGSSEVVVTNRLHCMIFCAITKTPCVVLPIKGNKIKGVYDWIKDLNYIKLIENYDINNICENIEKFKDIIPCDFNMKDNFNPIIDEINN